MLLVLKFYLKHLHKNDLKTTQNPQKQPPGGILKKVVLKNFAKLNQNFDGTTMNGIMAKNQMIMLEVLLRIEFTEM